VKRNALCPADESASGAAQHAAVSGRVPVALIAVGAKGAARPASVQPAAGPLPNTHFDRIGGAPAIRRLTERFYHHMDTLPEAAAIRAMHPADLTRSKDTLYKYLVGWMGGPPLYAAERGQPRLRHVHLPFSIGDAERDAWMACMNLALSEAVADESFRLEIAQAFQKTASFLRNRSNISPVANQPRTKP